MLPLILAVLFLAQGALAVPNLYVSAYAANQIPVSPDSGRLVNSFIVDGSAAYLDAADIPFYAQMLLTSLNDMANSRDVSTQAAAVVDAIATIGELVSGIPGDSCESAAVINAYVNSNGNKSGVKQAALNYVNRFSTYIDLINQLIINPSSIKFSTGPRGSCLGGGRTYQFEEAWDAIFNNANAYNIGYFNEIYCAARRMYNAWGITSNNVASGVTAVSIPVINEAAQAALPDLANFLRAVAAGSNPTQAAAKAKASFAQALVNIPV